MSEGDSEVSQLLTENLSDTLARAEAGDALAARDVLESLAFLLSTQNTHPKTGEPLPVPNSARDYLARALYRMARGENASRAMNLKKPGPKKDHFKKRLAAAVMFQIIKQHETAILEAREMAAELIAAHVAKEPCPVAWRAFKDNPPSGETLQNWYYECKDELALIYKDCDL